MFKHLYQSGNLTPKTGSLALSLMVLAGILLAFEISVTQAQSNENEWSIPIILFETEGRAQISEPYITADQSGAVHVFWNVGEVSEDSSQTGLDLIYYTRWDGIRWTAPIDIVAAPRASAPGAVVDSFGQVHLLWAGPSANLYYSQASVSKAMSALGWTEPTIIGQGNFHAQIVADSKGRLHRAYAGTGAAGLYYQTSNDKGITWSPPVNVSPTAGFNSMADFVRLAVSDNGAIHLVWTELQLPTSWPPTGVYYIRSTDGGQTWGDYAELAGPGYDQITVAMVDDKNVHVAWNSMAGVSGRFHRWSADGGQNWSSALMINPASGTTGPPQLVVDSAGTLHLLMDLNGCAAYTSWQGQRWSPSICLSDGAARTDYIEESVMTLSAGNRLHVVFWDDRRRLWYTTKQVSAPTVLPNPFPTEEILPLEIAPLTALQPHTLIPTAAPTAAPSLGKAVEEESNRVNSGLSILISILSVVLLIGGTIIIQVLRIRRH